MLRLSAAQLLENRKADDKLRLVWVDIGGGTGTYLHSSPSFTIRCVDSLYRRLQHRSNARVHPHPDLRRRLPRRYLRAALKDRARAVRGKRMEERARHTPRRRFVHAPRAWLVQTFGRLWVSQLRDVQLLPLHGKSPSSPPTSSP